MPLGLVNPYCPSDVGNAALAMLSRLVNRIVRGAEAEVALSESGRSLIPVSQVSALGVTRVSASVDWASCREIDSTSAPRWSAQSPDRALVTWQRRKDGRPVKARYEMHRVKVSSSNLVSVGYDAGSKMLQIEFNSGAIYDYDDVPEDVYEGLMSAGSHGRYFHRRIRDIYVCRPVG